MKKIFKNNFRELSVIIAIVIMCVIFGRGSGRRDGQNLSRTAHGGRRGGLPGKPALQGL